MIREFRDQRPFDGSPGLIAVFHALRRLLAPRHPPHALSSLAALTPPSRARPRGGPARKTKAGYAKSRPAPGGAGSNDPTLLGLMQRSPLRNTDLRQPEPPQARSLS